jgi:hypothetical protein
MPPDPAEHKPIQPGAPDLRSDPNRSGPDYFWLMLIAFTLLKLFIHLVTNLWGGYGYFRDELYYMACSQHLDTGYVDQPPLSILILAGSRSLIGDSLFALRLIPAIIGAANVLMTGLIVRELGGKNISVVLASVASIVSLAGLASDSAYSMNCFDYLFWTIAAYVFVRLLKTSENHYWLVLGIIMGFGALNKIDMLWYGGALVVGLLFTEYRSDLKTQWPWVAALIALAIFHPYILWNIRHDFAHLEFIRNAASQKYAGLSAKTFAIGQLLVQNPVTAPLWIAGLAGLLFRRAWFPYRALAFAFLAVFLLLILNGSSKAEYLSPAYGMLFAAGGVALENWLARARAVADIYAVMLAAGIILAPVVLPILPVNAYIRYAALMGVTPSSSESNELAELPQFYADMFGWEEKVAAVARVYHRLSPEEQSRCAIYGENYGRAAAIDFWRSKYGLPASIGSHNNYWIWGPRNYTGDVVIVLGGDLEGAQHYFEKAEIADSVSCRYCMPYENHLKIFLCRGLKIPMAQLWKELKHYI